MNNLNQYIIEKLHLDKNTKVQYLRPLGDRAYTESYNFLKKYLPDIDEWKYYIKIVDDDPNNSYIQYHFVYSMPDLYNKRAEMENQITSIELDGDRIFSGIIGLWKDKQCVVFYLNKKIVKDLY